MFLSIVLWDFTLNRVIVSQVYTIIAFGMSIILWPLSSQVPLNPSKDGTPLYLIHPFFTVEMFLSSSTALVWIMVALISLYTLRKQKIALTKSAVLNWLIVALAAATVLTAVSGCILYSQIIRFEERYYDEIRDMRAVPPPNPFGIIHGFGILFCEPTWIMIGVFKFLDHLKKRYGKWARPDLNRGNE